MAVSLAHASSPASASHHAKPDAEAPVSAEHEGCDSRLVPTLVRLDGLGCGCDLTDETEHTYMRYRLLVGLKCHHVPLVKLSLRGQLDGDRVENDFTNFSPQKTLTPKPDKLFPNFHCNIMFP